MGSQQLFLNSAAESATLAEQAEEQVMGMDAGRKALRERERERIVRHGRRSFNRAQDREGQKERRGKFVIMYGNGIMWLTTRGEMGREEEDEKDRTTTTRRTGQKRRMIESWRLVLLKRAGLL